MSDKNILYKDAYWIRFGNPKQSSSFTGYLEGKYLFFCSNQETLIELAKDEIENHGFNTAKVSVSASNGEYVCCLYWTDSDRKHELADRYGDKKDIKYRYWKANVDTRAGKYSKQYMGVA